MFKINVKYITQKADNQITLKAHAKKHKNP